MASSACGDGLAGARPAARLAPRGLARRAALAAASACGGARLGRCLCWRCLGARLSASPPRRALLGAGGAAIARRHARGRPGRPRSSRGLRGGRSRRRSAAAPGASPRAPRPGSRMVRNRSTASSIERLRSRLVEHVGGRLELEQVVLRLGAVVDLVGQPAHAPVGVALEGGVAGLDLTADLLDELRARRSSGASGSSSTIRS